MKNKLILILILFGILSCNKISKNESIADKTKIDTLSLNNAAFESEAKSKSKNWYDDIAENYIKNSDNELIKISLKNKEDVEWLLDRTEKTDSTIFIFLILVKM